MKELGCLERVWKAYGMHMYDLHRILAISCEAPVVSKEILSRRHRDWKGDGIWGLPDKRK